MTLEELKATDEERDLLQLWELWQDKCIASGEEGEEASHRERELLKAHYEELGLPIGSTEASIALMYSAFLGGVQSALEVMAMGDGEGA